MQQSITRGKIDICVTFENNSSKGKNVVINKELANIYIKELKELAKEKCLINIDRPSFVKRLSYYISELNVLHPFREGNGRVIREFARQLALKNGYALNLTKVSPREMLEASKKSVIDTNDLEELIGMCLEQIKWISKTE